MIKIIDSIDRFDELESKCWSGALYTLNKIRENNKEDDFMYLLEDLFYDGVEITQLNDFIWFDDEYIYESLNMELE